MDTGIFYAGLTIIVGLVAAGIAIRHPALVKRASQTESPLDDIVLAGHRQTAGGYDPRGLRIYRADPFRNSARAVAGFAIEQYVNAFFILIGAWIASSFSYNLLRTYGSAVAEKTETDIDDRLLPVLEIIAEIRDLVCRSPL